MSSAQAEVQRTSRRQTCHLHQVSCLVRPCATQHTHFPAQLHNSTRPLTHNKHENTIASDPCALTHTHTHTPPTWRQTQATATASRRNNSTPPGNNQNPPSLISFSMSTPLAVSQNSSDSTVLFQAPCTSIGVSRFRLLQYSAPSQHPSTISTGRSLTERCAMPKAVLLAMTAAQVGMILLREVSRKPLKSVSSSSGARTPAGYGSRACSPENHTHRQADRQTRVIHGHDVIQGFSHQGHGCTTLIKGTSNEAIRA